MTLAAAPWAIDGARTKARNARRAEFAALGRIEGVVEAPDLKVTALSTPGNGLQISMGNAVILNRYQETPNESYVVSNDATHEIIAAEMPTSQPTAKSYLVLLTVGDGEFAQVGHPWMPSEALDPEDAEDFQYVRTHILEVPAGTDSAAGLDLGYPALALARLAIPSNTTTITNGMITDLRTLVNPKIKEEWKFRDSATTNYINSIYPTFEAWVMSSESIKIPEWATVAKIQGYVESIAYTAGTAGQIRAAIVGVGVTTPTPYNKSDPDGIDYANLNFGGIIDVSAVAGQTKTFRIEAAAYSGEANEMYQNTSTTALMRVRFEEAPI